MIAAPARARSGAGRFVLAVSAVAAVLFLLWQLLAAAPASAHAVLESSDPVDGSRVAAAPSRVTFTFDETVQLPESATAALSDHGLRVDSGAAGLANGGRTVVVPLKGHLPDGAYTVSYRVVSSDGHVVGGAIRFGVNADPSAASAVKATAVDPVQVVSEAAQGLVYGGVVLLIGVGVAGRVVWPTAGARRAAAVLRWAGWGLLAGGTAIRLLLAGPVADGTGWAGALRLDGIGTALAEVGGAAGVVRLALLLLALPWTARPDRGGAAGSVAASVLGLAILWSVAADGHAAAGADAWLALPATTLHLAAMAVWIGGLIVLAVLVIPRLGGAADDAKRLRRWSVVAFTSVAVLIVTGEYQAWRQLDPLQSIADTAYGLTLLLKLALVALALVAALVSNRLLVRHGPPEQPVRRRRVRRIAAAETVVTIAVVIVTTMLVALPPARASYGPPTTVSAPAGTGVAEIAVDTTRTGPQTFTVRLEDAAGRPVAATSVTGTLATATVAGVQLHFSRKPTGEWVSRAIAPVAGEWTVALSIGLDGEQYATSATYRVWG